MNLAEFKAWFEGFTESMDGPPGLKAWARIRERVSEIKSDPTPLHRIVYEYPWYRPYWGAVPLGVAASSQLAAYQNAAQNASLATQDALSQNYQQAFHHLGRQEAALDS